MNGRKFLEKSITYISCGIKYTVAALVAPFVRNNAKCKDLWLISERGIDARDNGYYLFKYLTQNHSEINAAFAIKKKSTDRDRVEKLGRIIDHGSFEHYIALVVSKAKISTHIMGYTPNIDFFVRVDKCGLVGGKKVFLQHGITKDNLLYLYSNNINLDLFVCAAKPEYDYIHQNYGYDEKIVQMLGFCRYDDLYKIDELSHKILVMPTWRFNLRGATKEEFMKSEYYKAFENLINSKRLIEILEQYDYELYFYPHMEIQKYIDTFTAGERVKIMTFNDCTVQELLINSDILITDFSSVFFDYGYMGKPIVFYQFDEADFRKQHYSEGYFSYKRDAFGKVVYDENAVIDEVINILKNKSVMSDEFSDRVDKFFTLRDKKNSERNFYAIEDICK